MILVVLIRIRKRVRSSAKTKIIPSFSAIKEGYTSLAKPLSCPKRENVTAPSRCSEPLRSKDGEPKRSSPCYAGWDRLRMIGDTTSECDGVFATAVQSSSAFSAAIDRGTEGIEGVGDVEVCRGYHVYHAGGVRHACLSPYRSSE